MDTLIGRVIHYYSRLGVAVLVLNEDLRVGDTIAIEGHTTDLVQRVDSLEINHQKFTQVGPGVEVALKVDEPVRRGDKIFLEVREKAVPEGF